MNTVLNVGLKFFFDLSDTVYTLVLYITYNMGNRDLPDIYAHALRPTALGLGHNIYQANPSCPCYNLYIHIYIYIYIYVTPRFKTWPVLKPASSYVASYTELLTLNLTLTLTLHRLNRTIFQ